MQKIPSQHISIPNQTLKYPTSLPSTKSSIQKKQIANKIAINKFIINLSSVDTQISNSIKNHIDNKANKFQQCIHYNKNVEQLIINNELAIKMLAIAQKVDTSAEMPYKLIHKFEDQHLYQQLMPSVKKQQQSTVKKTQVSNFNSLKIQSKNKTKLQFLKDNIMILSEQIFVSSIAAIQQLQTGKTQNRNDAQRVEVIFQQCYPSVYMEKQELIQILGPEIYQLKLLKYKYYQHRQQQNKIHIFSCHYCMKIIPKQDLKYQCCSNLDYNATKPSYLTHPGIYHELLYNTLSHKKQKVDIQNIINTNQVFHGYNVYWIFQQNNNNPLCERVYCKKCYSLLYDVSKSSQSNSIKKYHKKKPFSCHFCLGNCDCKRCKTYQSLIEKSAEYIELGGDIKELKQNLIFPQYIKVFKKQSKIRKIEKPNINKCQSKQQKRKQKIIQKLFRNGFLETHEEIQQKSMVNNFQNVIYQMENSRQFETQNVIESKINRKIQQQLIVQKKKRQVQSKQQKQIQQKQQKWIIGKQQQQESQHLQQHYNNNEQQEQSESYSFDLLNDSPPCHNFRKPKDYFQKILEKLDSYS